MFQRIKECIKKWYHDIKLNSLGWQWDYKYLDLNKKLILIEYINKIARELAQTEGVKIYDIPIEEINKNEINKKEWACGVFIWKKDHTEYEKMKQELYLLNKEQALIIFEQRETNYPRIELSNDDNPSVYTLIHELGHYFIYKKQEIQSEEKANLYIEEFFEKHLPPFFRWIFQIDCHVRTHNDKQFTRQESYQYYQDYLEFIKNQKYETNI